MQAVVAGVEDRPAQAGEVERLRRRRDGDRPRRDVGPERGERDVPVRRVDELGVDLVADDGEVVAGGDLGEPLQLGPGEHVPGRVVRVAQQQEARRLAARAASSSSSWSNRHAPSTSLRRHVDQRRPAPPIVSRNGG